MKSVFQKVKKKKNIYIYIYNNNNGTVQGKNREQTSSISNQSLPIVIDMQLTLVKKVYFRASALAVAKKEEVILSHQKLTLLF